MERGTKVKVKVARGPFRAGDIGEFRFEHGGRLCIGGNFFGEIDFAPEEVEPAGPTASDGRQCVVFTTVGWIKGGRERVVLHAERLESPDSPLLEHPDAARMPRRGMFCRSVEGAKDVLEMARKIASQRPALTVDEWHDMTQRAIDPRRRGGG